MPSRPDDTSSAENALRLELDAVLSVAADQTIGDSLRELALIARRALACDFAAVQLLEDEGPNGHRAAELFVPVGFDVRPDDDTALVRVAFVLRGVVTGELLMAWPEGHEAYDAGRRRSADAIASAAGIVVERVRTAEANRLREAWHDAGVGLAKDIVAARGANAYELIVNRVTEIGSADTASVLTLGKTEDSYVVVASTGSAAQSYVGREIVIIDSITTRVMATGRPMSVPRLSDDAQLQYASNDANFADHSVAVIPLLGSGAQQGVIVVTRRPERPMMSRAEMGMATAFAGTIALALELAESQAKRDELVLVEERDRIARDLHDHVIQRLYAIGLSMQGLANTVEGPVENRLITSVDEIDETIKQIRSTIFRLTTPLLSPERSLRTRTEALLDDLTPALGFRPRMVSIGPVDFGLDEDVIDDCDAVLREGITNVARHAQATEAEVAISVSSSQLRLEIRDNGVGLGETTRRSGLANLRARAASHDGFMQVRSAPGDGTWLLWSIPLTGDSPT